MSTVSQIINFCTSFPAKIPQKLKYPAIAAIATAILGSMYLTYKAVRTYWSTASTNSPPTSKETTPPHQEIHLKTDQTPPNAALESTAPPYDAPLAATGRSVELSSPPNWEPYLEPLKSLRNLEPFTNILKHLNRLNTDVSWAKPYEQRENALLITPPFAQAVKFHENAKKFIETIVDTGEIFANRPDKPRDSVTFIHPHSIMKMKKNDQTKLLDANIFSYRSTNGVQHFIQEFRASDCPNIHVFGAASQFNSTEAVKPFVPKCGYAFEFAKTDRTQGPAVQNENRKIFEVIGAAANFGLNSLSKVLNTELAYNALSNGYLQPDPRTEALDQVLDCFYKNGDQMEVTCYHCDGIEVVLTAAPATGPNYLMPSNNVTNMALETTAAALAYSAQFNRYIELLQAHPEKRLVGHMTGVGLGAFANNPKAVADGFKLAALQFQKDLIAKGIDSNQVKVVYEVFENDFENQHSPANQFHQHLGLRHNLHANLHEFEE